MSRPTLSVIVLLTACACGTTTRGEPRSLQERLATLHERFPKPPEQYHWQYKQSHPPTIYTDAYGRYRANGEIVLIDGNRLAIRFDPGCPRPSFGSNHVLLSVYRDKTYKGDFLALETWNGYALGFIVLRVPHETLQVGDRVAHLIS